jgi:hypothetical protein
MKYSTQQPNWKAAIVEGESWEGTAEENTAKRQDLVGVIVILHGIFKIAQVIANYILCFW